MRPIRMGARRRLTLSEYRMGHLTAIKLMGRMNEAAEIMREVGSPHVKILFDIYHVQIMDGNLISTIRANLQHIGHFHVGDVPGRHEPGTGEINYTNVFHAIQEGGFRDFVAMEYSPSKDSMATLAEVRAMAYGKDAA